MRFARRVSSRKRENSHCVAIELLTTIPKFGHWTGNSVVARTAYPETFCLGLSHIFQKLCPP